ncbi:unnamed protein product, partial [Cylicostephanus goldi]
CKHLGTRFRPLSLQLPKPLFPIAGVPLVEHHIDQLSQLSGLSEIVLIGSYSSDLFTDFIGRCQQTYRISIKYAQEQQPMGKLQHVCCYPYSSPLFSKNVQMRGVKRILKLEMCFESKVGTAGGLVAHRELILKDSPAALFVINGDVCGDLPVDEMVNRIATLPEDSCLLLTTEATREQ